MVRDDEPLLSLRIGGAEVGPLLQFGLLLGGAVWLFKRGVLNRGAAGSKRGKWVLDRSLGGKRVGSVC